VCSVSLQATVPQKLGDYIGGINNVGPTVLCDGIFYKIFNYVTGLLRL
jgi:hypothetical protein